MAALIVAGCSEPDGQGKWIPADYLFPTLKAGTGKTLIYRKTGSPEQQSLTDVHRLVSNGQTYVLIKHYTPEAKYDSSKVVLEGETFRWLEAYNFYFSKTTKPLKGEIERIEFTQTGRYSTRSTATTYVNQEDMKATLSYSEAIEKDTVLVWQGRPLRCLVTNTKSTLEIKPNGLFTQTAGEVVALTAKSYYARGVGLIRYTIRQENDYSEWELTDVKEIH
jgi:hypothetical protein